ncbi:MAG: DUF3048 domain-containing protein, partial [Anaerolineales bacterium]
GDRAFCTVQTRARRVCVLMWVLTVAGKAIVMRKACSLFLISGVLAACGARVETSAPTSGLPTPVVLVGTSTPLPAGENPATFTPTAEAATPTAALPPTSTPEGRLGPDNFPPNVNPLTGELASDPSLLEHRPLAVKIVNQPPCARPQFGLNQAALMFEHYVEAWGTRFTAIFYGNEAEKVGAVRSARLIDLELPAIFDAVFVTSGSSGGVKQRLLESDFKERLINAELEAPCPPLCRVPVEAVACADAEHTMFTTTRDLLKQAASMGLDQRPPLSGWAFSAAPLVPGSSAATLHVNYLNSPVDWFYEQESGLYLRSQNGTRQVDALTKMRLTAANVVVLFAHHLYSDIRESTNFYSLEIQFWGQGRALVFRDGQAFEGSWLRPQRAGLFQMVDAMGAPIPLKPGRTWFEFVALDSPIEINNGEWTITATVLPQQTPP